MNLDESAPNPLPAKPFVWEADGPLAAEHELVWQHIVEAIMCNWVPPPTSPPPGVPPNSHEMVLRNWTTNHLQKVKNELDQTTAGRKILEADAAGCARLVLALAWQVIHYKESFEALTTLPRTDQSRGDWVTRRICVEALRRLLRRKLPLESIHLIKLAEWIASEKNGPAEMFYPLKSYVKAVENHGPVDVNDTALRTALTNLAQLFRHSGITENHKLAQKLETLLNSTSTADSVEAETTQRPPDGPDPALPAPAGSPHVLVQLKQVLGILPPDDVASTESVGLDQFQLRSDTIFREEHEFINPVLAEVIERRAFSKTDLSALNAGRTLLERDDVSRGRILLALAERYAYAYFVPRADPAEQRPWEPRGAVSSVFEALIKTQPQLDRDGLFDLLLFFDVLLYRGLGQPWHTYSGLIEQLLPVVESLAAHSPLTPGERHVLHRLRLRMVRTCPLGLPSAGVKTLNQLIGDQIVLALVPGEIWADAVNTDLGNAPRSKREQWLKLLQHDATATGSRPSAKWLKTANENLKQLGAEKFSAAILRWFPLVSDTQAVKTGRAQPGTLGRINDNNADCLRGLLWMSPAVVSQELIRVIGALTVSCYRKIPGVGPRAPKVGNAGVYALSQINDPLAVGQLALLKVKVKFGSAQKEIEKAFDAAAERSGLPREELEEMSVPVYGLTEVGVCDEPMGEFTAHLTVTGTTSTELVWVKADGKTQQAVPASVKASHSEDLKELQAAAKDIQKMLPAQRERIDSLFLHQKTWPLQVWRERYLNHPLVGTLARRLLWEFTSGDKKVTAIWFDGRMADLDLQPVKLPGGETTVQLWHPIGRNSDEVVAWRSWLDAQQIQQPFKQAHREIYLLTEAERNTRIYSNRYAAHVLKQHQFNALCAGRGWKNQLRLMVDADYLPATLHLPQWGLRAEFWIESLGADYGTDTNDNGVFLYLSTDQVRFYQLDAGRRTAHAGGGGYHPGYHQNDDDPLPLIEIPPLVFSEVMRDVDLFVGVASVGNDPAWNDGGPEGRYRAYWQNYSFGELNAPAKMRREVLERLMPRLKIASQCSFSDKFLVVNGSLRTYKIHLGSSNIQMEPNNQYLCIVPNSSMAAEGGDKFFLPFEGDRTLSVIISKAFLLADDAKIKDPTIVSQIKRV